MIKLINEDFEYDDKITMEFQNDVDWMTALNKFYRFLLASEFNIRYKDYIKSFGEILKDYEEDVYE